MDRNISSRCHQASGGGCIVLRLRAIGLPELQCPAPHRFVGNISTTFSQQIFDIPVAEGKPEIQRDDVQNKDGLKSVSGIGDFLHPATLLSDHQQITLLG